MMGKKLPITISSKSINRFPIKCSSIFGSCKKKGLLQYIKVGDHLKISRVLKTPKVTTIIKASFFEV